MRARADNMPTLNRSATVLTPKLPFLDWLYTTEATSAELTLLELIRAPTIYLIPECDTDEDVSRSSTRLVRTDLQGAAGGLV